MKSIFDNFVELNFTRMAKIVIVSKIFGEEIILKEIFSSRDFFEKSFWFDVSESDFKLS